MLLGVVSDTHNNLKNIYQVIDLFNARKVDFVVHTGDITNSNSLSKFSNLESQFFCVYGNNDLNEVGLEQTAKDNNFSLCLPPLIVDMGKRRIAIFHEPDLIKEFLLENNDLDIVLHGHTHRYREETLNNTLIFNPGESAGMLQGRNAIGIIDLDDMSISRIFF